MASCAIAAPAPPSTRPATSRRILTRDVLSRCSLVPQWAKRDSNPRPPACKAGALNRLSYSPVAPPLKGEAYREENAVAENQQNRRGGGRPASQQHVPDGERHHRGREKQPVLGSEMQARARQTLVGHKAESLRGNSKLVKQLGRRDPTPPTPRPAALCSRDRAAGARARATRGPAPRPPRTRPLPCSTRPSRTAATRPAASADRSRPPSRHTWPATPPRRASRPPGRHSVARA